MIQIIRGVYGHYVNGTVQAKGVDSPPFTIAPEKEERLVAQGVAVYVDDVSTVREELPELPPDVTAIPEYSIDMKPDELRAIAKQMGLTFKFGTTKAEMVTEMNRFLEEHTEDTLDEDPAPTFDAAEAVQ
jgi:hypothetical protein